MVCCFFKIKIKAVIICQDKSSMGVIGITASDMGKFDERSMNVDFLLEKEYIINKNNKIKL